MVRWAGVVRVRCAAAVAGGAQARAHEGQKIADGVVHGGVQKCGVGWRLSSASHRQSEIKRPRDLTEKGQKDHAKKTHP